MKTISRAEERFFFLTATIFLLLMFIFSTARCTSVQQTTQGSAMNYRADMIVTVGPNSFPALGVTKITGPTSMQFDTPITVDRIEVTSCAGFYVCQSGECDTQWPKGSNANPKTSFTQPSQWPTTHFDFAYYPSPRELGGNCPLLIEAFSKKDLSSWGYIAFRNDETFPGQSSFNGYANKFAGVSLGQSKAGLEQFLTFSEKARYAAEASCNLSTQDSLTFKFVPTLGICRATFLSPSGAIHRAIIFGYDSVLLRVL